MIPYATRNFAYIVNAYLEFVNLARWQHISSLIPIPRIVSCAPTIFQESGVPIINYYYILTLINIFLSKVIPNKEIKPLPLIEVVS